MRGKKFYSRLVTTVLIVSMVMASMTGCSKDSDSESSGQSTASTDDGYTYVAEYLDVDIADSESGYNTAFKLKGDFLYYYSIEYSDESVSNSLIKTSIADGSSEKLPVEIGDNDYLQYYDVSGDGSYAVLAQQYDDESGNASTTLISYDSNGNEINRADLTDIYTQDEYPSDLHLSDNGTIFIRNEASVEVFDQNCQKQNSIKYSSDISWIHASGLSEDGTMYILYSCTDGSSYGFKMGALDVAASKITPTSDYLKIQDGREMEACGSDVFMISNGDSLFITDVKGNEFTQVFDWLSCDINGMYVSAISSAGEDSYYALLDDWDTNETNVVQIKKVKKSEVAQRQEIVLGTLYNDSTITTAAVKFNKEHPEYHISIKTYYNITDASETSYQDALTAMNNDILSDSCPDIIDLSSMSVSSLAQKGLLADLNEYISASEKISSNDLLDSVVTGYTYDGKLVAIPNNLYILTLVGSVDEVGSESGWTVKEMMEAVAASGKAAIEYATKDAMLQILVSYDQDNYIDEVNGTCNFESDDFISALKFANTFPTEYDWDNEDGTSTATKIRNGKVMLADAYIMEPESIQEYQAYFNDECNFIGFPSSDGSGTYLKPYGLFGITTKSEVKDGAWAFIESSITDVDSDQYRFGVSPLKSEVEKQIAKAQKVEYVTDENGDYVLDDNGEKIIQGAGSIGYDDWEYTYHPVTDEEADIYRTLLNTAKVAKVADNKIYEIISEEAGAYFSGQKSPEEVASIIQSRVNIYIQETR